MISGLYYAEHTWPHLECLQTNRPEKKRISESSQGKNEKLKTDINISSLDLF